MEYITGDRFSPEFIEKRRLSLQAYIDRLTRHPSVQKSKVLRRFLESSELIPDTVVKGKESHVFENLSDALLNAFSKVRKPDERFVEFKDQLQKFEDNISAIEKLQSKLIKIQTELELDLLEFGNCFTTLGMMETQITGPLTDFSNIVRNVCSVLHDKIYSEDLEYLSSIREYIGYCQSVKAFLRSRDQKQVDFEELSTYLQNHVAERDRTMNPQRGGGGLASFLNSKMQELKGVDQEKARQQKLIKLASKINEGQLQEAVEVSNEVAIAFSKEVEKEIEFFQTIKLVDWKQYTKEHSETQIAYYQKVHTLLTLSKANTGARFFQSLQYWEQVIPILESIEVDPPQTL
ncbi:intercellular trafficking and secretion [Irineochytrium annulatum]|nr:intercellular trafficking and secretion [Irineochytrium annulatum]